MVRKYELTEREAELAFKQVSDHCSALKNWMASAVERGDIDAAQELVKELREHQDLYAKLNVSSHRVIDAWHAGTIKDGKVEMVGGARLVCSNKITE